MLLITVYTASNYEGINYGISSSYIYMHIYISSSIFILINRTNKNKTYYDCQVYLTHFDEKVDMTRSVIFHYMIQNNTTSSES